MTAPLADKSRAGTRAMMIILRLTFPEYKFLWKGCKNFNWKKHVLLLLFKNFYKVLGMAPYPSRNDSPCLQKFSCNFHDACFRKMFNWYSRNIRQMVQKLEEAIFRLHDRYVIDVSFQKQ